jgi:uncharacterized coiled-coil DUF342 family protein
MPKFSHSFNSEHAYNFLPKCVRKNIQSNNPEERPEAYRYGEPKKLTTEVKSNASENDESKKPPNNPPPVCRAEIRKKKRKNFWKGVGKVFKTALKVAAIVKCITPVGAALKIGTLVGKGLVKHIAAKALAKKLLLKKAKSALVGKSNLLSKVKKVAETFKKIKGKYDKINGKIQNIKSKLNGKFDAFTKPVKGKIDKLMNKLGPNAKKFLNKQMEKLQDKFKEKVQEFKEKLTGNDDERVDETIGLLEE